MKKIAKLSIMCIFICFVLTSSFPFEYEAGLMQDDKAPGFSLKSIKGKNVKLSDFQGKVVILHFWKTN